jgi:hypothetical protein
MLSEKAPADALSEHCLSPDFCAAKMVELRSNPQGPFRYAQSEEQKSSAPEPDSNRHPGTIRN